MRKRILKKMLSRKAGLLEAGERGAAYLVDKVSCNIELLCSVADAIYEELPLDRATATALRGRIGGPEAAL